jgi:hypothetical protein
MKLHHPCFLVIFPDETGRNNIMSNVSVTSPPHFLDKARLINTMPKHSITSNSSMATVWTMKTQEIHDFYGGSGDVMDFQEMKLPFHVESNST